MTNDQPRIAIVDDDPFVATHLKDAISERLPDAGGGMLETELHA